METQESKSVIKDRSKYVKGVSASGRATLNNGDEIATAVAGLGDHEINGLAKALIPGHDEFAYGHLNPGMRRMVIGNKLRAFRRSLTAEEKKLVKEGGSLPARTEAMIKFDEAVESLKSAAEAEAA